MPSALERRLFAYFLAAALLAALACSFPARAQDGTRRSEDKREVSAKFYPWALYGRAAGWGLGTGVQAENVPAPGVPRERFFGNDRLLAEVQYRRPLFDAFGLVRIGGVAGVGAGSVYDDLADQFSPRLTFDGLTLRLPQP